MFALLSIFGSGYYIYTMQYVVFLGVDTLYTITYSIFYGVDAIYNMQYVVFSGRGI